MCDPAGMLAYPLTTVAGGPAELATLVALVAEYEPVEVIVGFPRSLSGGEGPAATRMRSRAVALATALPVGADVRLVDERLSTVTASRRLSAAGKRARQQRALIDAAAAVAILEHAIEIERSSGRPPGELVLAG
jgi:putative holliday junction resolvase